MLGAMAGVNDPGTYEVVADGKTHTVDADGYEYASDGGDVKLYKGLETVAVFRWWSSVKRKSD